MSRSWPALARPGAQPATDLRTVRSDPTYLAALDHLDRAYDRFVRELVALTEIPAPPFGESARAEAYLGMLRDAGLEEIQQDAIGNVMGLRRGTGAGPLLAVAAHLDTVFPPETDVTVQRSGTRLRAAGIRG